jgi:hypothetical protein
MKAHDTVEKIVIKRQRFPGTTHENDGSACARESLFRDDQPPKRDVNADHRMKSISRGQQKSTRSASYFER